MLPPFPADIAAPPVASATGFALEPLFILIILIELIALRLLRWDTIWRCLLVAVVMNLVTTALGGLLLVLTDSRIDPDAALPALLAILALAWALSTAIEGAIMLAFRRDARGRAFGVAAIANGASYVLVALVLLLGR